MFAQVLVIRAAHFHAFLELCPGFREVFDTAAAAFMTLNTLDRMPDAVANVQEVREFRDAKGRSHRIKVHRLKAAFNEASPRRGYLAASRTLQPSRLCACET